MVTIFQAFMTMAAEIKNRVGPPAAAAPTAGSDCCHLSRDASPSVTIVFSLLLMLHKL